MHDAMKLAYALAAQKSLALPVAMKREYFHAMRDAIFGRELML